MAGWRQRLSERRERLRRRRILNAVYRITIGVIGFVVVVVGIIAIPYPGPGWAIFFLGLALLATEFAWAQRSLRFTKSRYDAVMAWLGRQHLVVQALGAVFTAVVVVVTLWMVGAVGWGAVLLGIDWPWLKSPIGIGS
ncbi:TIGR02611 family protein [Mycolicibacterium thermoresistibile]